MKVSLSVKSTLLAAVFIVSSCGTTKYSSDVAKNNYTNLESGKTYVFSLGGSSKKQRMVFTSQDETSINGFASKRDSTQISLQKSNVTSARDAKKSRVGTAAVIIGAAAAAALIIGSTRATSN